MSWPGIDWAGRTDAGRTRENNEDAFGVAAIGAGSPRPLGTEGPLAEFPERGVLFAVADGVGGQSAGEVASALAVAGVADELSRFEDCAEPLPSRECGRRLELAVRRTNGRIRQQAAGDAGKRGMAATLSCLWVLGHRAFFAQVGDSRLYRWRAGQLLQLSHDQSEVGRAVRAGRISEAESKLTMGRNVLEQALGMREETLNPEIDWIEPLPGDSYLLCSDGLVDRLQDRDLAECLRASLGRDDGLAAAADALLLRAQESQSRDNVTVLLVRLPGASEALPLPAARTVEPQAAPAPTEAKVEEARPRLPVRRVVIAALAGAAVGAAAGYLIAARMAQADAQDVPTNLPAGQVHEAP